MEPVTIQDLFAFIMSLFDVFGAYLYVGFTLLLASSALILARRLIIGYKL